MNMKKQLWAVTCMGLPVVGFALICMGVYLMSLRSEGRYDSLRVVMAYIHMVGGFLAMFTGVWWAVCHGMKSKLYLQGGRRHARWPPQQIYTIDRPFPPSYEESQRSHVDPDFIEMVGQGGTDSMEMMVQEEGAPPLYTEHSSDVIIMHHFSDATAIHAL